MAGSGRRQWRMGNYLIIRKADLLATDHPLPHLPDLAATVSRWLASPVQRALAIEMFNIATSSSGGHSPKDLEKLVKPKLVSCFERGVLVALTTTAGASEGGVGGGGATPATAAAAAIAAAEARRKSQSAKSSTTQSEKKPEKTWFRCQLLDEDGEPMASEPYVLDDSDGAHREGKLNDQGIVYIPPTLTPGNCRISFPKMHLNPRKK